MKDISDEEMQEMFEKNMPGLNKENIAGDEKDLKVYSMLFEALGKEPEIPLRYNFSARVAEAIQSKKDRLSYLKLYVFMGLGFLIVLSGVFLYLGSVSNTPPSQLIQLLVKYRWALAFAAAALLLIQFLDKQLIQRKAV